MDSTMEHSAVARAGLFSCPFSLFEHNDTERTVPAPLPQLPGESTPDNPSADNTDIICFHLVESFGSKNRPSKRWWGHRDTFSRQRVFSKHQAGGFACRMVPISTGRYCLCFAGADVRPLSKRLRPQNWSRPACVLPTS